MDPAALELDAVKFAKTAVTLDQRGKYNEAVFYYKVSGGTSRDLSNTAGVSGALCSLQLHSARPQVVRRRCEGAETSWFQWDTTVQRLPQLARPAAGSLFCFRVSVERMTSV